MKLVQDVRIREGRPGRRTWVTILALLAAAPLPAAATEPAFDDVLFRQCISWMLDGQRGALIENRCIDEYAIPPPSLFICARKVLAGFDSERDRDGCALIFDEQARKARAGHVK
jgi:hypothetical protein